MLGLEDLLTRYQQELEGSMGGKSDGDEKRLEKKTRLNVPFTPKTHVRRRKKPTRHLIPYTPFPMKEIAMNIDRMVLRFAGSLHPYKPVAFAGLVAKVVVVHRFCRGQPHPGFLYRVLSDGKAPESLRVKAG